MHYDLYLHPNLDTGLYTGKVSVLVNSTDESRDHFHLHVKHLEITSAKLTAENDENEIEVVEAFPYDRNEFYVMRTNEPVEPGQYKMTYEFKGNLSRGIVGFYKSVYTNAQGDKIPIATSKFQPTYARQAFPCFDEPSFKSTFTITMVRPSKDYVALSNMPVQKETPNAPTNGLTEVKFQKSVPMVTYLACFIVCDFEYEEKFTAKHNTKFRVYATPNQKNRVRYSLEIGANITDFFEDYFDIKYPLPKQDMIAIPDFVSGAMEHWGLITYRENRITL